MKQQRPKHSQITSLISLLFILNKQAIIFTTKLEMKFYWRESTPRARITWTASYYHRLYRITTNYCPGSCRIYECTRVYADKFANVFCIARRIKLQVEFHPGFCGEL